MREHDLTASQDVPLLQTRILNLQALICELLEKNERLRLAIGPPLNDYLAWIPLSVADSPKSRPINATRHPQS